ncbi:MAG: NAD(+)/NADH kinase [Candidatus Aminicenantes bacterium]|nr:NAD(+)/NADH kinase [Candidatus Aminicenantes bacterium]
MVRKVERAGIVIKPHAPRVDQIVLELKNWLEKKGIECFLEDAAASKIGASHGFPREVLPTKVDLVIVLGGDGTLLSVAHVAAQAGVPVVGINMGRLGFLTEVPLEEMWLTLEAYLAGREDIISSRWLLETFCQGKIYYCLNDAVINKGAVARMIQIALWINGKEIAILKADGLIISTPTGSTAYSLSAGGPILQPHIPAIILAPICPHTLTFRPMVISSDSEVKAQLLTGGEEVYLSLDGQRGVLLMKGDIIITRRASLELKLVSSPRRNFFDLLQDKLGWGALPKSEKSD